MKRVWMIILALSIMAGVAGAAWLSTGKGWAITASTTSARTSLGGDYVKTLSIYNSGTNTVYAAVNISLADFNTLMVTTNAVPIPSSNSFSFAAHGKVKIESFAYETLVGSSGILVGAY